MESRPTWLEVVALALRDRYGRVLLQKRPENRHHGGLWEFPGGKVERGENPRAALCREIAEELGIDIETANLAPALVADQQGEVPVVLILYTGDAWSGEIAGHDGQQWGWFTLAEAAALPMPPMDADLRERLAR